MFSDRLRRIRRRCGALLQSIVGVVVGLSPAPADVVITLGTVSVAYGSYLAWHPAGFIVGGILMTYIGLLMARKAAKGKATT